MTVPLNGTFAKKNHYVPQFLINNWANNDGNVHVWRRVNGQVIDTWQKSKNIMAQNHLYRLNKVALDKQTVIESVFASIEGRAAKTLVNILAGNCGELSIEQKKDWSLLVMANRCRIPSRMERMKQALDEPQYAELKLQLEGQGTDLQDYVLELMVKSASNVEALRCLLGMRWSLGTFINTHPVLLGDNPIVVEGNLFGDNCILSFPVSPKHVFVAASTKELHDKALSIDGARIVEALNRVQAREAQREIIGNVEKRFLEKYFCIESS